MTDADLSATALDLGPTRHATPDSRPAAAQVSGTRPALTLRSVHREYVDGEEVVAALSGVSLRVDQGSFLAVMGPSGSGKTTLLHCASGLDRTTSGTVTIGDTTVSSLKEPELTHFRRDRVGFVFQSYNLLPTLTAEDNITLPLRLAGRPPDREWLEELVRLVGVGDRLHRRPGELSGGQQQRVAIVRALAARPDIVFADEPTGALDSARARGILALLRGIVDELGQTVVMVTHDVKAAVNAHSTAVMSDGRIADVLHGSDADALNRRLASLERN
ncbi:ABC transporter ATP-binding protein [Spiractinospora alimapuensis]|uniref:ABC transporter ATP-binding protein n=1 Tax=Spiractinospora alimapuensis TaxID=2820884 RepID=UPI001F1C335C|nr:ABC transporter ATP-binding protein [Spiractinospora alimapuensis]QVQ51167.1 ABC transporter ATP-binding protein [Spiractinospora alimapuensis]